MFDYPVTIHTDGNPGVALTCDDLPEFNSAGDDIEDALCEAVDGIESALSIYVDQRRVIPVASAPTRGQRVVHLPAVNVAKIVLWNEMMSRDMRKADLCRLLGVSQTQGDRLVDFLHASKMEAVEKALAALGKRLSISVLGERFITASGFGETVERSSRCSSDCICSSIIKGSSTCGPG